MKKLIFSMLAMAAMVSCSNEGDPINEVNPPVDGEKVEIKFGQSISVLTKAPLTGTKLPNSSQVGLWITEYTDASYTWAVENFKNNISLTSNEAGLGYTTSDEQAYYSIVADTKYDFYAYHPFATADNGISVNAAAAGLAPTIGIILKTDPSTQIDLMYANLIAQTRKKEAVNLEFKHALAQVKFTVKKEANANAEKLTDIKVVTQGTSVMNLTDGALSVPADDVTIIPLAKGDVTIGNTLAGVGSPIMVIPTGNISSVIFTIDNKDYTFIPTNVTLTANETTTIDVNVTATGVTFTHSVQDWTEKTDHGTGEI